MQRCVISSGLAVTKPGRAFWVTYLLLLMHDRMMYDERRRAIGEVCDARSPPFCSSHIDELDMDELDMSLIKCGRS